MITLGIRLTRRELAKERVASTQITRKNIENDVVSGGRRIRDTLLRGIARERRLTLDFD